MTAYRRQCTFRITPELADRLNLATIVTSQTANAIVGDALTAWLTRLEATSGYQDRRAEIIRATTGAAQEGQQQ